MSKRIFGLALALAMALLVGACQSQTAKPTTATDTNDAQASVGGKTMSDKTSGSTLRVITSFDAVASMVRAVGQDHVQVATLAPTGDVDVHTFEPDAKAIVRLKDAHLFVINGFGLEPWLDKTVKAADNAKLVIVDTSKGIDPIKADADEDDEHDHDKDSHDADEHDHDGHDKDAHHHGGTDPHIWLGLSTGIKQVTTIRDALINADPAHKADYEANAKRLTDALSSLLSTYKEKFKTVPSHDFITGHGAFAYFCRDFGLKQTSVQGVFSHSEPSPKALSQLVDLCRKRHIHVVFSEPSEAVKRVSETLAKEVNAQVLVIDTMESGPANGEPSDYLDRMKANLETIYKGMSH